MQLPTTIGLHRSYFLGVGLYLAHGLALIAILVPAWEWGVQGGLAAGILVSAGLSWRLGSPSIRKLHLLADGCVECQLRSGEDFLAAEVLPDATVHPWLTVVRLKVADRRVVVVVLPDSTTSEDFRRLRVWLRWRAEFIPSKNAA